MVLWRLYGFRDSCRGTANPGVTARKLYSGNHALSREFCRRIGLFRPGGVLKGMMAK